MTYFEHVHFVDNLEGKANNTASAREGLWSLIVAAATQESIQCGHPIMIDEFLSDLDVL